MNTVCDKSECERRMALTSYWLFVLWVMALVNLYLAYERTRRRTAHYAEFVKQLKELEDEQLVHMEQETKSA